MGTECGQNMFCPSKSIDRKTMAVWVVRMFSLQDPTAVSESRFVDVDAESFYAPYVERAAEMGVTTGCGDGTRFCPDGPVTRAQMAVFLARAYALPDGPDPGFSDVSEDAWYASAVAKLAASGITAGCGDGTRFCPDRHTTRSEMATFLARAARLVRVPGSAEDFGSVLAIGAAEISAAIADIDVERWAENLAPHVSGPEVLSEMLASADAGQVTAFLSHIDTAAIDAAARAIAADNARAVAYAVRIGYETSAAWDDRQAAVHATREAARLAVPLNPDPVDFDRVRSFEAAAYPAAYDDYFADPELNRGTGEQDIVRAAAYVRTRAAKAARAAARTAAIAAAAPAFEAKAADDVRATAYYDAETDTYTDYWAFFNAYDDTRQAVRRLSQTASIDVAAAYDEAYIAALGVEVERQWSDDDASVIKSYEVYIRVMKVAIEAHETRFGVEVEVPWRSDDDDDQAIATIAEYEAYISTIESAIESHEAAFGVEVRGPGPSWLQNRLEVRAAESLVRHYYSPILPIYDAFRDAKLEALRRQEDELLERRNNQLLTDDPEYVVLSAAGSAYFFGGMIDDRYVQTGTYREFGSYYDDPNSAAAAAYMATYYNTYGHYVSRVVGETVFLGVYLALSEVLWADFQQARVADVYIAQNAVGIAVTRLVGEGLARHVEGRFSADRAANMMLGAYGGSDLFLTVLQEVSSKNLLFGCYLRTIGDQRIVDILSKALDEQ